MNTKRLARLIFSFLCGFLLVIGLVMMISSQARDVQAGVDGVIRYVSTTGDDSANDCTESATPCRTVQHAVYEAQNGDEIHVATGTYTGTMVDPAILSGVSATLIISKNISSILGGFTPDFTIRDPILYETILSAETSPGAFGVYISDTNTLLDGFTVRGAHGAYYPDPSSLYWGGAIRIRGGSPTISNNLIKENAAFGRGGGIFTSYGATPIIMGNTIYSNTIISLQGGDSFGGGIFVLSGYPIIAENSIISNSAEVSGGGIYVDWNVGASIYSNTIAYNKVISPTVGYGAGISISGDSLNVNISHNDIYQNYSQIGGSGIHAGPVILDGNYIHQNNIPQWGSGIYIDGAGTTQPITITNNIIVDNYGTGVLGQNIHDLRVINNTIAGNLFVQPDSPGNGIEIGSWPIIPTNTYTATLLNNILVNNSNCGIYAANVVSLNIDYNDVYANGVDYCDLADPPSGEHNISADPMFVDPATGDYRLLPGSPAINAGDNSYAPSFDFAGTPRPQGLIVDIGAYEFIFNKLFLPLALK